MGTRSDIIVHRQDGKWHRIYCHWDGYLEHNGRILFDHYTSQRQCEDLAALGDLSVLGERIGVKHPFDKPAFGTPAYEVHAKKYAGMCTAYGRDRGESNVAGTIADTLAGCWPENDTWTEFTYVWDDGKWWCGDPDEGSQTLVDLGELLTGRRVLKPAVKAFGMVIGQHQAHDSKNPDQHVWSK